MYKLFSDFEVVVSGVDCPHNDIHSAAISMEACKSECKMNRACVAFVTNAAGTQCWLKSKCDAPGNSNGDRYVYRKSK